MSFVSQLELFSTIEDIQNIKCANPECLFTYLPCSDFPSLSNFFKPDQPALNTILHHLQVHKTSCESLPIHLSLYHKYFKLELTSSYQCQNKPSSLKSTEASFLFYTKNFIKTKDFFKSLKITPCDICLSSHSCTLNLNYLPFYLFITFSSILLATQDTLAILSSIPLFFNSNDLFVCPDKKDFTLSGLVFQNSKDFVTLTINKNRTFSSKALKITEGSLYDSIDYLVQQGFYPTLLFYGSSNLRPYKISEYAWQLMISRHVSCKIIFTCSCGLIRESKCPCGSSRFRSGWTCSCERQSEKTLCECGKILYKCQRCLSLYIDHCNCTNLRPEIQCGVCLSQNPNDYRICKTCLNPNPNLF